MNRCQSYMFLMSATLCGALIYVYPLSLPTPLVDPDEGLHASISQEMVERGDYLIPRFLGKPFLDKAILYFEVQALSLRCFGNNEVAVRLPGLLFGLASAFSTALLAYRLYDWSTGTIALIVALTLIVPFSVAQFATHDVALVPWTNLLVLCWWGATHEISWHRQSAYACGAALFVCLAVLTKGLIGVAIIVVGYTLYVVVARKPIAKFLIYSATSLSVGLLLASPWFLLVEKRVPGFLYYYFIQRHVLGYVAHEQPHGNEPWYFYLVPLFGGTIPWVLFALPGLWQDWSNRWRARENTNDSTLLMLCWVLGGFVFLTAAKSKLITYALPLFPPIAILAADSCQRFLNGNLSPNVMKAFARIFVVSSLVASVTPLALVVGLDHYRNISWPPMAYVIALIVAIIPLGALVLLRSGQKEMSLAAAPLWFPGIFVLVMTWPMQTIAKQHSQRELAMEIRSLANFPDHIYLSGARVASLIFYLTPLERRALRSGQIADVDPDIASSWSEVPPSTLLAVKNKVCQQWLNTPLVQHVPPFTTAGDYQLFKADDVSQ
jgi:4-amino-4-deoxy-L-arabinose transferase